MFSSLFHAWTLALLASSGLLSAGAIADGITEPKLLAGQGYSEYWEQQFLFDNGTFATSQFLITNLPLSTHHGLMVATLKTPGEETIVLKNGRRKSGWQYAKGDEPQLSIFQHRLASADLGFLVRLDNTAAEMDLLYRADSPAISLISEKNNLGLPAVTLYAPTAQVFGRWRKGPELGGEGYDGEWSSLGFGRGYGIHVVQRQDINIKVRRWVRVSSVSDQNIYEPIIHFFETHKKEQYAVLVFVSDQGDHITFENIAFIAGSQDGQWFLTAHRETMSVSGTIEFQQKLEVFELSKELTVIEKMVAGSTADIVRSRSIAHFSLVLDEEGTKTKLAGRALLEDIMFGKKKKKRRRTRR